MAMPAVAMRMAGAEARRCRLFDFWPKNLRAMNRANDCGHRDPYRAAEKEGESRGQDVKIMSVVLGAMCLAGYISLSIT